MIDKLTAQKIKDAADIVEVVSDYVHLTRRGANYMGLCPFHNERTPSFSVNKGRNFCYCFSCHKGGSPVNFIMEKEGVGYQDALRHLAAKYGIKIEERELTDEERKAQSEREAMLIANEWALSKMHHYLLSTEEGQDVGLQYLYGRGITQEAIKEFRLGYSPDRTGTIWKDARAEGISTDVLKSLGILGTSQDGRTYDRFRGRVMFPIFNSAGKVIAFGGRDLKGAPAKYINSPESALYKKSNELYGMYQAKNAIVKADRCFLVEGYMDVIGMWQSGLKNTIASSGTALTDGQIALIHRFTNNVTLIYDGDAAGIKASMRGIDMLLSHNLDIRVVLLPDGDDPDSFARKHTPEEFRDYIEKHQKDFIRFKTEILLDGSSDDPISRSSAVKSVIESISAIADKVKRSAYIRECSRILEISEEILTYETDKARAGVVEKITRQRNYESAAKDSAEENKSPAFREQKASTYSIPVLSHLDALERKVIYYCIRYGMMEYGESADTEGNVCTLTVAEMIREDMQVNEYEFSNPLYSKIFGTIISLMDDYAADMSAYTEKLDSALNERREKGIAEIAAKGLDMEGIEKEESILAESLGNERAESLVRYARDYASGILASHEDDEIRKLAISMMTSKYKLSKYHTKLTRIESEEDRLPELIDRALNEWKQGILNAEFTRLLDRLSEVQKNGYFSEISEIQASILEIEKIRRDFASSTGDRVIIPKSISR